MSAPTVAPEKELLPKGHLKENYLKAGHTLASWLLTKDHKRIGILYFFAVNFFFFVGSVSAGLIRLELTSPTGLFMSSDTYNKAFTAHGVVMVFLFLIVAIPAIFGNFLLPLMIGARDLAFPRLNLLSWYMYMIAGTLIMTAIAMGGVDTGWTFYTPMSSVYSSTQVTMTLIGVFIGGFSSIFTGINFIVTIHKMRAPGMTWFRLPLFVWAHYATSIVIILGTPVVAITLLMVVVERQMGIGIFSPELGGDPVLFQHMFWFYSHPAVYIMVLPAMGVISELISCFSRSKIFGYEFVAMSSMGIAALGFIVWGHHMFVSSQSMYQGIVFSLASFLVAIPSAIKIFNWTFTMYKGSVWLASPMVYALGFIGLFTVGGLTGLHLASMGTDVHLTGTYFIVAHFHYVMVGGSLFAYLGAMHFWWPKMFGRMYPEALAKWNALIVFAGFNLTFLPQFVVGFLGMPRRYHFYYFAPEFRIYHIMSTLGSSVLAIGLFVILGYFTWSLFKGPLAPANPWGAKGLEWTAATSPPEMHNFPGVPVIDFDVYDYDAEDYERIDRGEEPLRMKENEVKFIK